MMYDDNPDHEGLVSISSIPVQSMIQLVVALVLLLVYAVFRFKFGPLDSYLNWGATMFSLSFAVNFCVVLLMNDVRFNDSRIVASSLVGKRKDFAFSEVVGIRDYFGIYRLIFYRNGKLEGFYFIPAKPGIRRLTFEDLAGERKAYRYYFDSFRKKVIRAAILNQARINGEK